MYIVFFKIYVIILIKIMWVGIVYYILYLMIFEFIKLCDEDFVCVVGIFIGYKIVVILLWWIFLKNCVCGIYNYFVLIYLN